jgi:hypothetical protein
MSSFIPATSVVPVSEGSENTTASILTQNSLVLNIPTIVDTNVATIALIRANLFPDTSYLYRITFTYQYSTLTFSGTPSLGGTMNLTLFQQYTAPTTSVACSVVNVRQAIPNGNRNIGGTISYVTRLPVPQTAGNPFFLTLTNDTGALVTGGTVQISSFCVEEVTKSFTTITSIN